MAVLVHKDGKRVMLLFIEGRKKLLLSFSEQAFRILRIGVTYKSKHIELSGDLPTPRPRGGDRRPRSPRSNPAKRKRKTKE
ncbi:MAG: hypothetical protein WBK28_00510 [Minisyncoccia bacterium]